MDNHPIRPDPILQMTDVSFAYRGGPTILNGVSLAIGPGDRIGLTGHNGAGKSTLFHILVGLIKPDEGQIFVYGEACRHEKAFMALRRKVGLIFQDPDDQLFCPTVADDIAFGPLNMGCSMAEASLKTDGILERLKIAHLRNRVTHKLSAGEKRLVSLATILVMEPDILLLDEPSNALDEPTVERLIEILNSLPQALVVISHDPYFRDSVIKEKLVLQQGKLYPAGTNDQIPKQNKAL